MYVSDVSDAIMYGRGLFLFDSGALCLGFFVVYTYSKNIVITLV